MSDTDPTPNPPTPAPFGGKYRWLAIVITSIVVPALTYLATWLNGGPVQTPAFGWRDDAAARAAILATMPKPLFADAGADIVGSWDGKRTVLLSDAAKKAFGQHIPTQKQTRGTCVSRAFTAAVNYLQAVMAAQGEASGWKDASHAVCYGLTKEVMNDVGPQNRSPNGDGAYGAAAAKALTTLGNVTDQEASDENNSDVLAIKFAVSGVPAELKALAKKKLVRTASKVTSFAEAADAISNGYPVTVCSNVGFEPVPAKRDAEGFLKARGNWSHAQCFIGVRGGNRPGLLCLNSWGDSWVSGPMGEGMDIPPGSYWIDKSTCERMIAQGDTFAVSNFDGFVPRELDWFVAAPVKQRFGWRPDLMRKPPAGGRALMQPPVLAH